MKCSESLGLGLLAWGCACVVYAADSVGDKVAGLAGKFAAIERPALVVKTPEKAVLLSGIALGSRLVAVGERGLVVLSDDGGKRWQQAKSVPTSVTLTAVKAMPDGTLFLTGHGGVLLRSQDQGLTWVRVTQGARLAAAAAARADELLTAAEPNAERVRRDATRLEADGPDKPLFDIAFQNNRRGMAVGAYNLAFITDDGGATWRSVMDRLDNPKTLHLHAVAMQGDSWLIAGEQGLLLRSKDGGRSFTRLTSPYQGSWFAIASQGPDRWVLAGLRGHAFVSQDDGNSWQPLEGATPASLVAVLPRADGSLLFTSQAGQLLVARDGAALRVLPTPTLPPLAYSLLTGQGDVIALGFAGAVRLPGVSK